MIGRTRTDLEFLPAEAVLEDLPKRLHDLQTAMSEVSDAVSRRFFTDRRASDKAMTDRLEPRRSQPRDERAKSCLATQ